jgi:hypothetical protein
LDLLVLTTEITHADYHALRDYYMTAHRLIDCFKSGSLTKERSDSAALYFGRAAHTRIIEGLANYETEYTIGGPINPRTGKTYGTQSKAFGAWAATQDRPAITPEEHELIEAMNVAVANNKAAAKLLSSGQAEVTGRTEILEVPCQIRVDWLTTDWRIVDLKTTSDLQFFDVSIQTYGYLIQQAFYRQCVERITGKRCEVFLIAVDKNQPARCEVWRLNDAELDAQCEANEQKISEFRDLFFSLTREAKRCLPQSGPSSKNSTTPPPPQSSYHQPNRRPPADSKALSAKAS